MTDIDKENNNMSKAPNRIPKLRFPGFGGEWMVKKLREIVEKVNAKNKTNKVQLVFSNSAVQGIVLQNEYFDKSIANKDNLTEYYIVKPFDFVYNPRISSNAKVGAMSVNRTEKTGLVSPLYTVFRLNSNLFNNSFIEMRFKSKVWHNYMRSIANYGARDDRMNIKSDDFFALPIKAPSYKEQVKVASFLSLIDSRIQTQNKIIEQLETLIMGLMGKLFSQKIGFKEFKHSWKLKKLGEIFYSEKGHGLSKDKLTINGKYECVLYGELYTRYKEEIFNVISKTNEEGGLKSQIGDLLIPSSTTTSGIDLANVTAINKENVILGGDITVLRSKEKINNVFYSYYLSNYKKEIIASYAQGSTIVHLYYNHIKNMLIDFPSFEEQTKIANFLSSINLKIELENQLLQKLEEQKKFLLQNMFI